MKKNKNEHKKKLRDSKEITQKQLQALGEQDEYSHLEMDAREERALEQKIKTGWFYFDSFT